jgi:hypothetical protein
VQGIMKACFKQEAYLATNGQVKSWNTSSKYDD